MNNKIKSSLFSTIVITVLSIVISNMNLIFAAEEDNEDRYIISIPKQENQEKNKAIYDDEAQKRAKEIKTSEDLLKANGEEITKKEHITWSGQVLDDITFKNRMGYCISMQMGGLIDSVDDGTVCSFYVLSQDGEQAIVNYVLSPEQIELREKAENLDYYIDQLNK